MILSALFGRTETLPPHMLARFPELAGARYRRGGLPPRVAGWFLGRSTVAGVTLWSTVWLAKSGALDEELLLHELRHVAQFGTSWAFPFLYIWETLRRGYWMNRFEIDARTHAARRIREPNPS
jgi:hypothetical protein